MANDSNDFLDRVHCGDALEILKTIPDRSVDLIVTDPPYGDNVGYGINNIRIAGNEHPLLALTVMSRAYRVLKKNTTAYMFCGMRHLSFIRQFFTSYTSYRIKETIIWNKVSMGLGEGFRKQYELVLVLEKGKPEYRNPQMLNLLSVPRVSHTGSTGEDAIIVHPHEKPIALIEQLILHSSDAGDIVLDPFLGSGTTAVAAKRLDRRFIGVELNAQYFQMAKERLQQGVLPTRVSIKHH